MYPRNYVDNPSTICKRKISSHSAKEEFPIRLQYAIKLLSVIEHSLNPLHIHCRLLDIGLDRKDSLLLGRYYEILVYRRLISYAWAIILFLQQLKEEQKSVTFDNSQILIFLRIPLVSFSLYSYKTLGGWLFKLQFINFGENIHELFLSIARSPPFDDFYNVEQKSACN